MTKIARCQQSHLTDEESLRCAAILTCHDRCQQTIACLESLSVECPDMDIYLTDDGCTDDTAKEVARRFPKARILEGDGTLFWNRGMHLAWSEAMKGDYDYYLWVNDDVRLYKGFLDELLTCEELVGGRTIVSGIIEDASTHEVLYGGSTADKRLIQPSDAPEELKYMNGNIVLVPRDVVREIGILDPRLHHDLGDVDYGLTAHEHCIKTVCTRHAIGSGTRNDYCRVRKWHTDIISRFKKLNTPLGAPLAINFYFRRKHYGVFHALAFCLHLIILNILPDTIVQMLWPDVYIDK